MSPPPATNANLRCATHGIEVDYDAFEKLAPPDPARRYHVYHAMDLNFRLKVNSKAVDAGQALPTINDGFTGRAPDLGTLELNQPEPHYGTRWITWKPFYRYGPQRLHPGAVRMILCGNSARADCAIPRGGLARFA